MSATHHMKGCRLEFVLREFKGERKLTKRRFDSKEGRIKDVVVKEHGGYILYTPNGHAYYLTKDEAAKRGFLGRKPNIINLDQVNDTDTAAGRFKHAIDGDEKRRAYIEMEQEVIKACTSRGGRIVPGEQADAERDEMFAEFQEELEDAA